MTPGTPQPAIASSSSTAASPIPPAAGTTAPRWPILGGSLRLVLGTPHHEALRTGDTLDLPLPPEATPRQIQDRAEAWLRDRQTDTATGHRTKVGAGGTARAAPGAVLRRARALGRGPGR
jgi:hypothetical protein